MANCSDNTYYIFYTDSNNGVIAIPKSALDQTTLDITLFGKTRFEYGVDFNQNVLHLMERFASNGDDNENPDIGSIYSNLLEKPVVGQLWYNKITKRCYVYANDKWNRLFSFGDVASNSGTVLHGEQLPLPLSQVDGQFDISECSWHISPSSNSEYGEVLGFNVYADENAVVTAEYTLSGNQIVYGHANYIIIGIRSEDQAYNEGVCPIPSPTPTPSVSSTPGLTVTPTPTPSVSASSGVTPTPSASAGATPTPSASAGVTPTPTRSPTPTPAAGVTPTPTRSPTPTPTRSPTPTPTSTAAVTPTPTPVASPTSTPIVTASPTPTITITPTPVVVVGMPQTTFEDGQIYAPGTGQTTVIIYIDFEAGGTYNVSDIANPNGNWMEPPTPALSSQYEIRLATPVLTGNGTRFPTGTYNSWINMGATVSFGAESTANTTVHSLTFSAAYEIRHASTLSIVDSGTIQISSTADQS